MGVDAVWPDLALDGSVARQAAPAWNRFAHWPRPQALALVVAALALLIAAALVPITVGRGELAKPPPLSVSGQAHIRPRPRDDDLKLYDIAVARMRNGENYYSFIAAEHRHARYPLRPAVAVRLPTLAWLEAWAGSTGQIWAAVALMLGVLHAWWRRLGEELGGRRSRDAAMALLFTSAALGLNRYFFALHELWAGMLIALSFGLHRVAGARGDIRAWSVGAASHHPQPPPLKRRGLLPCRIAPPPVQRRGLAGGALPGFLANVINHGTIPAPPAPVRLRPPQGEQEIGPSRSGRWLGAWCAAALALAIREHTLPFVLLMGAFAAWRHAWREAAAWTLLAMLFAIALAFHIHLIDAQTLATDPVGPSWLAWRGFGGWLSDIVLSSNLRFLPHWLAGPAVVLMVLGWAGWRSDAGSFATLLYLGYGVLFMIAGRDDNFYWGAMIAPTMFIGLAFVPMALSGLVEALEKKTAPLV